MDIIDRLSDVKEALTVSTHLQEIIDEAIDEIIRLRERIAGNDCGSAQGTFQKSFPKVPGYYWIKYHEYEIDDKIEYIDSFRIEIINEIIAKDPNRIHPWFQCQFAGPIIHPEDKS